MSCQHPIRRLNVLICLHWRCSIKSQRTSSNYGIRHTPHQLAYVSLNRDVFYSLHTSNSESEEHVGRVRWICSIKANQFVVLQRMQEQESVYSRGQGTTLHDRLTYLAGPAPNQSLDHDVAKRHCRQFKLMNAAHVRSFHVIQLSGGSYPTTIDGIVMLQPDFLEVVPETGEHTRFFNMPYIIQ